MDLKIRPSSRFLFDAWLAWFATSVLLESVKYFQEFLEFRKTCSYGHRWLSFGHLRVHAAARQTAPVVQVQSTSSSITLGISVIPWNASMTFEKLCQVFQAVFFPLPLNGDTVSLSVMAWKTGKELRISWPIVSTSWWTGMYLKFAPVPKATHSSSRLILVKHSNSHDYHICVNCSYTYFLATFVERICNMQEESGQLLPENMGLVGQIYLHQSSEYFLATCSEDCFISNGLVCDLLW